MNVELIPLEVEQANGGLTLLLTHCTPERPSRGGPGAGRAALLLHGGNSSSATFTRPEGGLARYLTDENDWDVWLLDYRTSPFVQNALTKDPTKFLGGSLAAERLLFTLDRIVAVDLPEAEKRVRERIAPGVPLSVMGHCIGGGSVALAIARGYLQSVANVVLSGLGLFYEVSWNGWIKAEDYLVERSLATDATCRGIDPKDDATWPDVMRAAYERWPKPWLPPGDTPGQALLARLTFMFGQPYFLERLHPSLRGDALLDAFGNMHIGLYWHISQMVRRGFAAQFGAPDVVDRARLRWRARIEDTPTDQPPDGVVFEDLASGRAFRDKVVTVVSGAQNRLWHRDSMDLMFDWLKNRACGGRGAFYKQVYAQYGLQDIVWGADAKDAVYRDLQRALLGLPPAV